MATTDTQDNKPEAEDLSIEERSDGTAVVVGLPEDRESRQEEASSTSTEEEDEDRAAPVSGRGEHDEDDGPTEAEELRAAATQADREAIRARRRKERKDRKAAQAEREQTLRNELSTLRAQNSQLNERFNIMDRRASGAELAQIDAAIGTATNEVEFFKQEMAAAISTSNGTAHAEALTKLLAASNREAALRNLRQRAGTPQQQTQAVDPVMVNLARGWMERNKWYNPQNPDDDARVVLGLDAGLVQEGYQPNTPAYWAALDKKVAKFLPHRTQRANGDILPSERKPARSVVTGSGRESSGGSSTANEFVLSTERVQALKDAGYWNDPKMRASMIKDFREYDRKAAASKS